MFGNLFPWVFVQSFSTECVSHHFWQTFVLNISLSVKMLHNSIQLNVFYVLNITKNNPVTKELNNHETCLLVFCFFVPLSEWDMRQSVCFWNYVAGFVSHEYNYSIQQTMLAWPCSSSMCQFLWSFYMQQPKVNLRVHPMLSVSCSHRATTATGFLPPTSRRELSFFTFLPL